MTAPDRLLSDYIKFYRANNRIKILKLAIVSGTDSIPIFRVLVIKKLGTESVPERLESFNILTRLLARENFIEICRRENIKTYIIRLFGCSNTGNLQEFSVIIVVVLARVEQRTFQI